MAKFIKIRTKIGTELFKFFMSSVAHYHLTFVKGSPGKPKGTVLFSHGRGATPFMYSTILRYLARNWNILSPQHSEVNETPFTDLA
jgi:hypothetical protein